MLNENIINNPYFNIGLLLGDDNGPPQQRCNCNFNAINHQINQINQDLDNFIATL